MDNMEIYNKLSTPPDNALRPITGHPRLNGKTDINPQWRYEALTEVYGGYGLGWYIDIVDIQTQAIPATGELMIFALVHLYVKDGENWSKPAPGYGGDFIIKKNKNGLYSNDEAYKMAVTDAIGTAAKLFGVAADVYRGKIQNGYSDSKYSNRQAENDKEGHKTAEKKASAKDETNDLELNEKLLKTLKINARHLGLNASDLKMMIAEKYGKEMWNDLNIAEKRDLANKTKTIWAEITEKIGGAA